MKTEEVKRIVNRIWSTADVLSELPEPLKNYIKYKLCEAILEGEKHGIENAFSDAREAFLCIERFAHGKAFQVTAEWHHMLAKQSTLTEKQLDMLELSIIRKQ